MDDLFWIKNPKNLFNSVCLIPTKDMSTNEKLNTLSRLIILVTLALIAYSFKDAIKFFVVGITLVISYYFCSSKEPEAQAIGSDFGRSIPTGEFPKTLSGFDEDSLLSVNNPDYGNYDIGPRDPESIQSMFTAGVNSAGNELTSSGKKAEMIAAVGGGYGNYAPNVNSISAFPVGSNLDTTQPNSLLWANRDPEDDERDRDSSRRAWRATTSHAKGIPPDTARAGYTPGGGWGHGWSPSTGLTSEPTMNAVAAGSLAYENDVGMNFLETQGADNRENYAELAAPLVYSGYNTVGNSYPTSGVPTPPGLSGQNYLNTVYVIPEAARHPDAGYSMPNTGMAGLSINGDYMNSAHQAATERMDLKKKASRNLGMSYMSSNAAAASMQLNGQPANLIHTKTGGIALRQEMLNERDASSTHAAGVSSDYSSNYESNLVSGDSGNNDPEHYITTDKREPIDRNAFINQQNIASYQPSLYMQPIERSERLDAKSYQMWKDLTMFDDNPPKGSINQLMVDAGTGNIADESYQPTYYKDAERREEIKKNTFSSFINERTAQDHAILDDIPNFRQEMMRDYTPLRRRPITFRSGNNMPQEFATPGNVPLVPLRPPMTPYPPTSLY